MTLTDDDDDVFGFAKKKPHCINLFFCCFCLIFILFSRGEKIGIRGGGVGKKEGGKEEQNGRGVTRVSPRIAEDRQEREKTTPSRWEKKFPLDCGQKAKVPSLHSQV